MPLHHFTFYPFLLGLPLSGGRHATDGHVRVYGAILAHHKGPAGCIAGNRALAEDTGLKETTVRNLVSDLSKAEWVGVKMASRSRRLKITPNPKQLSFLNDTVSLKNARGEYKNEAKVSFSNDHRREIKNRYFDDTNLRPQRPLGED